MQKSNCSNDLDDSVGIKFASSAEKLVCTKELSSNTI